METAVKDAVLKEQVTIEEETPIEQVREILRQYNGQRIHVLKNISGYSGSTHITGMVYEEPDNGGIFMEVDDPKHFGGDNHREPLDLIISEMHDYSNCERMPESFQLSKIRIYTFDG